jgi:hypothetical protein
LFDCFADEGSAKLELENPQRIVTLAVGDRIHQNQSAKLEESAPAATT